MNLLVPDWIDAPDTVGALSTLRSGGISQGPYDDDAGKGGFNLGLHVDDRRQDVAHNRALLQTTLPAAPAWLSQVHGVAVVDAAAASVVAAAGDALQADASVTDQAGVVCAIMSADCLPVLFADIEGRVVGAAHAGWRGLAGGVLTNTIDAMRALNAGDITAWLGPAIGPQRFEVGAEVVAAFIDVSAANHAAFMPIAGKTGKYMADIYLLARFALHAEGVNKISGGAFCTVTERQRFYSFRRDGRTGRMASLIWIK